MLVVSQDGRYRASVTSHPYGCEVTIWRVGERTHNSSTDMRRLTPVGKWSFEVPLHVVLDEMVNLVEAMSKLTIHSKINTKEK